MKRIAIGLAISVVLAMLVLTVPKPQQAGAVTVHPSVDYRGTMTTITPTPTLEWDYAVCLNKGQPLQTPQCKFLSAAITGSVQPYPSTADPMAHLTIDAQFGAFYVNFSHDDVTSAAFMALLGYGISAVSAVLCGGIAFANPFAGIACEVYMIGAAAAIVYAMIVAANRISWYHAFWCDKSPWVICESGFGPDMGAAGNVDQYDTIGAGNGLDQWPWIVALQTTGLTLGIHWWGTPAGASFT